MTSGEIFSGGHVALILLLLIDNQIANTVVSGQLQYRLVEISLKLKARASHQFETFEINIRLHTFFNRFIETAGWDADVYI